MENVEKRVNEVFAVIRANEVIRANGGRRVLLVRKENAESVEHQVSLEFRVNQDHAVKWE